MTDHQHCINCLEEAEGLYSYPCQQCGWSPDQYTEAGLYLAPGTILNSQYQIARMLGHGGFGITYLAWDNLLQRRLAIKEYMPRDFATRNSANTTISVFAGEAGENFAYGLERFLDEARTLAKFQQHAGIVSVLNVFYANSTGYMVMEYVDGRTLKDYLTEQGPLTWDQTVHLFMPVMDALREVHKNGVMHRDISPDNIYLCNDKRVKLLDFGAARNALGGHSQSLSVVVKPGYAPEEQYRAKGKQGPWTDVYSVAASMYRCVTGVVPPDALDRLDEDELVTPSALGVQIPQKAEAALLSALAIKANERTQSIEAFQHAIWDQSNRNEPSINKANTQKKVVPPKVIKEEPTTIEFSESTINYVEEAMQELNATIKNKYPSIGKLKKIKLKWYVGLIVIILFWRAMIVIQITPVTLPASQLDDFYSFHKLGYKGQGATKYKDRWYTEMSHQEIHNAVTIDDLEILASAFEGDPMAQWMLGDSYESGRTVHKNEVTAIKWYRLAAEKGNADAISALKRLGVYEQSTLAEEGITAPTNKDGKEQSKLPAAIEEEGTTAIDDSTGKPIIFHNGKWVFNKDGKEQSKLPAAIEEEGTTAIDDRTGKPIIFHNGKWVFNSFKN